MRQTKQRKALQIERFLAWLPMGAVAVLTIALIQPFAPMDLQGNSIWNCVKGQNSVHVRATYHADDSKMTLVLTALHHL